MKNQALLLTMIIAMFCSSCAIRNVTSHNPVEVQEPYTDLLVLFVENVPAGVYGLDRASYNKYLRHKFNNEQNQAFREILSSAFLLELPHARVLTKAHLFKLQQDYTYKEFMETIKDNGIQSLIVISTSEESPLLREIEPNMNTARRMGYQSYMLDLERNQLIWFQGGAIADSTDELFAKRIARLAARDLKKHNIIIAKSR